MCYSRARRGINMSGTVVMSTPPGYSWLSDCNQLAYVYANASTIFDTQPKLDGAENNTKPWHAWSGSSKRC